MLNQFIDKLKFFLLNKLSFMALTKSKRLLISVCIFFIEAYSFIKKHYLIIGTLYLLVNLYFNRIIPATIGFVVLLFVHFEDHPRFRAFNENIRRNKSFLLYHYKSEFILNTIYTFTRINYIFAPLFFIFCEGVSFLSENITGYAALIVFFILLDICTSFYISKYRNFSAEFKYVFFEMTPRVCGALISIYVPYANLNPTHGPSHIWHRYGPRFFGAHEAVAYQLGFQDPATTTMEGIYLFNLHLLFIIISLVIVVGWLFFSVLTNFTEFDNSEVATFVQSNRVEIVWSLFFSTIADLFHKFGIMAKKAIHAVRNPKNTYEPPFYILALIFIGVFVYFQIYVFAHYLFVGVIYLTYFSEVLPCDKGSLLRAHKAIDELNYNKVQISFGMLGVLAMLSVMGLFFNLLIAKIYLAVFVMVTVLQSLEFKFTSYFSYLVKLSKSLQKDRVTLQYHWYTHLKVYRNVNHVNLITLVSLLFFSIFVGDISSYISPEMIELNTNLWLCLLVSHVVFVGVIDVYILFRLNMPAEAPIVGLCRVCVTTGTTVVCSLYGMSENGLLEPNRVSNSVRHLFGQPDVEGKEQVKLYRLMRHYYRFIPKEEFLIDTGKVQFGSPVYELNAHRAWELVQLNKHLVDEQVVNPLERHTLRMDVPIDPNKNLGQMSNNPKLQSYPVTNPGETQPQQGFKTPQEPRQPSRYYQDNHGVN